jgi:hypothetical protein
VGRLDCITSCFPTRLRHRTTGSKSVPSAVTSCRPAAFRSTHKTQETVTHTILKSHKPVVCSERLPFSSLSSSNTEVNQLLHQVNHFEIRSRSERFMHKMRPHSKQNCQRPTRRTKSATLQLRSFKPLKPTGVPAALTTSKSAFCIYRFRTILGIHSDYFHERR